MKLRDYPLAFELKLPVDLATETFGFLGRKGRGKTYGAQRWFELLFKSGVQCVALDPVGNWWALRAGKDGKSPGLAVYVFGGPHGDVPLEPGAGAYIAKVVVETGISVILDVSRFRKGERKRFMTAFAEEFFHLKKDAPSAVHLFVEEAHVFCPQRPREGEEPMLGAMEDVVRIGRNYGIGVTLISQRAATVNKDVLSQVECLIAYQTSSAQDKKAIKEWIEENEDEEAVALMKELKSLQRGEALFWSPSVLRVFKKIHVTEKETLDASSTPKVGGKRRRPTKLAQVDLAKIHEAMKEVVASAEANDVSALKKKLAEKDKFIRALEERLVEFGNAAGLTMSSRKKMRELVPLITPKQLSHLERIAARIEKDTKRLDQTREWMDKARDRLAQAQQAVVSEVDNLRRQVQLQVKKIDDDNMKLAGSLPPQLRDDAVRMHMQSKPKIGAPTWPSARVPVVEAKTENGEWVPPQGARMILAVLARAGAGGLPRRDTAIKALMTPTSGTFTTYVSKLKSNGYIGEADGNLVLVKSLPNLPSPPEPGDPLVEEWAKELDGKAKDILRFVAREYPTEFDRPKIADGVGMPPDSGTFTTYMSRISGKGLFEKVGRRIKASSAMMEL